MIISDKGLLQMLNNGALGVTPMQPEQIQPASVDLRLGYEFLIPNDRSTIIDIRKEPEGKSRIVDAKKGFIIEPGQFILG